MRVNHKDLIERLQKRAEIRRQITTRKSVQNNEPDRIADLLEEAAKAIQTLEYYAQKIVWAQEITMTGTRSEQYEEGFWDAVEFVKEKQLNAHTS